MPETFFAPPERTDRRKFENQIVSIGQNPLMNVLLKSVGGLLVVLNEDRQVVALNHAFLDALGIQDPAAVLGLRLGETLQCIHAEDEPHGCGTTAYCATCGAAIAMMAAINDDKTDEQVCALITTKDGAIQDTCLLIRAQPLLVEQNRWILIFAQDITQQQFWITLERVFFHDINNILTSLLGNSELLAEEQPEHRKVRQIRLAAERLSNEVSLQRSLSHQKDTHYLIRKKDIVLKEVRKEVDLILSGHPAKDNKTLEAVWPSEDVTIYTDIMLVSRVLGNMLINALEATPEGGSVHIKTLPEPGHVVWDVWNEGEIPSNIQKRVFQKHFSTKAKLGRGLGTFSMKLFGERYLGGEVTFTSSLERGTIFTFRLPRR